MGARPVRDRVAPDPLTSQATTRRGHRSTWPNLNTKCAADAAPASPAANPAIASNGETAGPSGPDRPAAGGSRSLTSQADEGQLIPMSSKQTREARKAGAANLREARGRLDAVCRNQVRRGQREENRTNDYQQERLREAEQGQSFISRWLNG